MIYTEISATLCGCKNSFQSINSLSSSIHFPPYPPASPVPIGLYTPPPSRSTPEYVAI